MTEFRRMVDALKEADRRKDEFVATLAHELRNPLAPIQNAVEIMRLAGNDPATVEQVRDVLDRQVRQLSGIVEDLIDVTRIVERKVELHKELVPLSKIVETALESCRSLFEACGHQLTVTLPPEPVYLDADLVRLSQVFTNLLVNAGKYTKAGGQIWFTAERSGGELIVRVRDTGVGIEPELLPHVFDMFRQGEGGPEQGRSGLGVGLTLVRSLVEMHGGRIEVHSAGAGQGSEFIVHLPLAAQQESAPQTPTAKPASHHPLRILIVDDNQDQARSLGKLLRLMGHEIQLAYGGPSAVEAAVAFRPDVALVDIGLPGMNGYEVARRIREDPELRDILLVAQTGWGQEQDRRRSQAAGFDHHLVKPVRAEALDEVLRMRHRR